MANRVVAVVGQPDRIVRRHVDAMRPHEDALAPRAQEIAVAVEHTHRVLAAVEGVDVVFLVDADRGDVGVELHAGRQLSPIVGHIVTIGVRSKYYRHGVLPICESPDEFAAIIEAHSRGTIPIRPRAAEVAAHKIPWPFVCGSLLALTGAPRTPKF